jgi:hypothetical protein
MNISIETAYEMSPTKHRAEMNSVRAFDQTLLANPTMSAQKLWRREAGWAM